DRVTKAMQHAMDETQRRRAIQTIYNHENNIVPKTIIKTVIDVLEIDPFVKNQEPDPNLELDLTKIQSIQDFNKQIKKLEKQMQILAKNLEFEKAAAIRDQIMLLKKNIIRI
ncbi:MAG: UvrB/UvrC motif-containing protein, partial [Gammaproteobacteria bacterium]